MIEIKSTKWLPLWIWFAQHSVLQGAKPSANIRNSKLMFVWNSNFFPLQETKKTPGASWLVSTDQVFTQPLSF